LKAHRHCPLVLLVKVDLKEGKALGNGKGKWLSIELCYERREEREKGHCGLSWRFLYYHVFRVNMDGFLIDDRIYWSL
jgi:hypothetical protein